MPNHGWDEERPVSYERHLGRIEERVKGCEEALNKVEGTLERIRDRVPPWIVWVMTAMGGIIGSLVTLVAK